MQHAAASPDAADAADGGGARPNCPGVGDPPDGGCVCYVLATAFSSSQGELMRMIEFSTAQVRWMVAAGRLGGWRMIDD
eukprot:6679957-Prymnesium_polylepis.1